MAAEERAHPGAGDSFSSHGLIGPRTFALVPRYDHANIARWMLGLNAGNGAALVMRIFLPDSSGDHRQLRVAGRCSFGLGVVCLIMTDGFAAINSSICLGLIRQ